MTGNKQNQLYLNRGKKKKKKVIVCNTILRTLVLNIIGTGYTRIHSLKNDR